MADISYFNSPCKPAPSANHPASLGPQQRIPQKRRMTDDESDMFTQRVCVARYDEPSFCPSDASALFPGESLSRIAAAANSDAEPMDLDEDDDDDDDNDMGGVALQPDDHDYYATDALEDISYTGPAVQTPHEIQSIDDIDSYHRVDPPFPAPGARSGQDHLLYPPPEPSTSEVQDISQRAQHGEDGAVGVGEAQLNIAAALSHRLRNGGSQAFHESHNMAPSVMRSPVSAQHASRRQQLAANSQRLLPLNRTLPGGDPALTPTTSEILELPLDDDALAVDDPQRNYDFADFMDIWRLRALRDKRLPRFELGVQPPVRLGQSREVNRSQVEAGAIDMQGLHWKLIGPLRDQVTSARMLLHPSALPPTSKQKCTVEEYQYRFRSFNPRHRAKFNHYQLRNVLAASSRNEIYYATGSQVRFASLACPGVDDTVLDLSQPSDCAADFRITCLSATRRDQSNSGAVVAGGFYGEYAVLPLDMLDPRPHEGFVTHAYNGLVTHIHNFADRRSGLPQAAFCSNDRSVRLMDVRTLQFTNSFNYENSVNCSATSPDGRLRVLVGDSREVLITDASSGNSLLTLQDHNDHGFACDWSPDGRYVAAAAQDSKTVIWDTRNWSEPVRTIYSSMSCARSLHFTDDSALVVAENDDIVRIYDRGHFKHCQNIHFFGSIAGVVLLDGGAEMAIANADKTVGGLLTFERATQGYGNGSYGRMTAPAGEYQRDRRKRNMMEDLVANVVV